MTFTYANAESTLITDGTRFIPVDKDNADYAHILADGVAIEPYVAPPAPVPDVSALQMLSVLVINGNITETEALNRSVFPASLSPALAALPPQEQTVLKIRWANLTTVSRSDALVASMGAMLGLTDEQIDALFIQAAAL